MIRGMSPGRLASGILLFRRGERGLEVLLAHPGGPFWTNKDEGAWTLPKGEPAPGEDALACARRELEEETGLTSSGPFTDLGEIRQKSGKVVHAWAAAGEGDPATMKSNTFTMEWPPKSGRMASFPEVDRWGWFDLDEARRRMNPAQTALLDRLAESIGS
jgi:predicted NUDIX family NTP pyrophosphohydrolase